MSNHEAAPTPVDDLSWHELLHGVDIANKTLDLALSYPAVQSVLGQNNALSEKALKAREALADLYQAIGDAAPER